MSTTIRFLPAAIASVAWLLAACTTARKTEPLAPPLDLSNPNVARGQKVFFQHCHQCHPHGQGGLGPAIVNKPLPEFLMKFQVRHGLGTMPSFGAEKIPQGDLEALMEYLKAVRGNPPLPNTSTKRDSPPRSGWPESESRVTAARTKYRSAPAR